MATSPIYGWPEPDNSSLVKNGAQDIRALGDAIDTTMATMIPKSLIAAKGDLVAASANDTPAILSVGNSGETIVADSSTSTGLRYNANYAAGKNKFINGAFDVWQRGAGTFTKTTGNEVYTADRWAISNDAGTITCAQQTFTPGTAPVAGYEGQYFARITTTASGSNALYLIQKIEDVRTFAGQTVTLSYWAKVSSGTVTNTPLAIQAFGSGGSGDVVTSLSSSTITTTWTRFTHTVAIPSISGKTVGTSSSLQMQVLRVGVSATIDVWGYQIEASNTATAFQTATGTIQGELAACQRYYYRTGVGSANNTTYGVGMATAGTTAAIYIQYPVTMRVLPSSIDYADLAVSDLVNYTIVLSSLALSDRNNIGGKVQATVASGLSTYRPTFLINNTNLTGYLGFSAEL